MSRSIFTKSPIEDNFLVFHQISHARLSVYSLISFNKHALTRLQSTLLLFKLFSEGLQRLRNEGALEPERKGNEEGNVDANGQLSPLRPKSAQTNHCRVLRLGKQEVKRHGFTSERQYNSGFALLEKILWSLKL